MAKKKYDISKALGGKKPVKPKTFNEEEAVKKIHSKPSKNSPDEFKRVNFYIRRDLQSRLKYLTIESDKTIKDLFNEIIEDYLDRNDG